MRWIRGIAALLGWFALVAQLFITSANVRAEERTVLDGLITYLSYFTVLTNLLAAITLTVPLVAPAARLSAFLERPTTQGAVATYITVVGIVYSALLRHLWQPQGLQLVVDSLLHDVIPVVFDLQWLLFVRKRSLRWQHPLLWLGYPLAYVMYTLIVGGLRGRYPYPFAD